MYPIHAAYVQHSNEKEFLTNRFSHSLF